MADTPRTPTIGALTLTASSGPVLSYNGQRSEIPRLGSARRLRGAAKYAAPLPGYFKVKTGTVTVDSPSISAGAVGHVNVTVTGAKANARHRVVLIPHASFEATLSALDSPIIATNTVHLRIRNVSAGTVDGASLSWAYRLYSKVP